MDPSGWVQMAVGAQKRIKLVVGTGLARTGVQKRILARKFFLLVPHPSLRLLLLLRETEALKVHSGPTRRPVDSRVDECSENAATL